jgi:hypothetical protein
MTPLFSYRSQTVEIEAAGQETETDISSTAWGLREEVTGELGYGVGDSLVLGALVQLGGASETTESEGGAESDSSEFQLFVGPKLDYAFSPESNVRPFVGVAVGFLTATSETETIDLSLTGVQLMGRVGLRAFVAKGFSIDPALAFSWLTASGDVEVGTVDTDASTSAFGVGLLLGFSGWVP